MIKKFEDYLLEKAKDFDFFKNKLFMIKCIKRPVSRIKNFIVGNEYLVRDIHDTNPNFLNVQGETVGLYINKRFFEIPEELQTIIDKKFKAREFNL